MRRPAVLLALVVACGGGSASEDGGGTTTPTGGSTSCPDGFALDAASQACMDVAPDDCGAGTAPFLGSKACAPVGWTCAAPYEKDPSGWGCRPTLAAKCASTEIETFGVATCAPVDDCNAPFPPANATYVVDATLATEDATHFKTVFGAVGAANKGDVVAIMPGTYVEDVDVARDDITIAGKCSSQVTLKNPGDKRAGFLVNGARGVKISGVTLTGHMDAILVMGGGDATLDRSLVISNRWMGVYVAESGSHLKVTHTRIQDVVPDGGKFGWGASAQIGATLELEDVVIDQATSYGIGSSNPGSKVSIRNVVVRNTRVGASDTFATGLGLGDGDADVDGLFVDGASTLAVSASNGKLTGKHLVATGTKTTPNAPGRALQVSMGGHADLTESFITKSDDANVLVIGKGSTAKITSSVFSEGGSHGIRVAQGASLDLSTSALVANTEVGLSLQDPGTHGTAHDILVTGTRGDKLGVGVGVGWAAVLDLEHSAIEKNRAAGVLVSQLQGAAPIANIKSTLVRRTNPDPNGIGDGIQASAGGVVNVDGCALVENMQVSAFVGKGGSSMTLKNTLLRDTHQPSPNVFGHGLIADDGGSLAVDGSWIVGHPGVGIAVSNGAATVARSLVARCAVAVHVQGGSELQLADTVPDAPQASQLVISNDTRFIDDQTRVGSGDIPMPDVLAGTRAKP